MQMDDMDRRLVNLLAENARTPVASLAATLGLARSTVQARLDRLERAGTITGYTVRLGAEATRRRIQATVLAQVEPKQTATVLHRLKALPGVERAHTASGRFDLVLTVVATDTAALDAVLDQIGAIPGVRATESLIHLATRIDRAPV